MSVRFFTNTGDPHRLPLLINTGDRGRPYKIYLVVSRCRASSPDKLVFAIFQAVSDFVGGLNTHQVNHVLAVGLEVPNFLDGHRLLQHIKLRLGNRLVESVGPYDIDL